MTALEQEFVKDHREMTRALVAVQAALEDKDDALAIRLADQLDVIAGPHIQFEESILYPAVARTSGKEFHQQLLAEHQQPLAAVRLLLNHIEQPQLPVSERDQLIKQIQVGVKHVETCGRLLSHLTSLDEQTQARYLKELRELRSAHLRWSELDGLGDRPKPTMS